MHNTGHPHTHILVRGVTDDGKILNIAGDYIAYGVRERASEIVTLELGRQTEQEVARSLEREVDADRFTRLDRMLIAEQQGQEFMDLRPDQDMRDTFRQNRALLIGRARKLERMGLATEIDTGRWSVAPEAEPVLRELGERGDIIKTMHRAQERDGLAEDRHPSRYVLHRANMTDRVAGRVLPATTSRASLSALLSCCPSAARPTEARIRFAVTSQRLLAPSSRKISGWPTLRLTGFVSR